MHNQTTTYHVCLIPWCHEQLCVRHVHLSGGLESLGQFERSADVGDHFAEPTLSCEAGQSDLTIDHPISASLKSNSGRNVLVSPSEDRPGTELIRQETEAAPAE